MSLASRSYSSSGNTKGNSQRLVYSVFTTWDPYCNLGFFQRPRMSGLIFSIFIPKQSEVKQNKNVICNLVILKTCIILYPYNTVAKSIKHNACEWNLVTCY